MTTKFKVKFLANGKPKRCGSIIKLASHSKGNQSLFKSTHKMPISIISTIHKRNFKPSTHIHTLKAQYTKKKLKPFTHIHNRTIHKRNLKPFTHIHTLKGVERLVDLIYN